MGLPTTQGTSIIRDQRSRSAQSREIVAYFNHIAKRYEVTNFLISLGLDHCWRRKFIRQVSTWPVPLILDVACGSGDILAALADQAVAKEQRIIGLDLSPAMLHEAAEKVKKLQAATMLVQADGMALPFAENSIPGMTIVFGIRNFPNLDAACKELYRVLQPGGRLAILEFSLPSNRFMAAIIQLWLRHVVPFMGGFLTGDRNAYRYFADSVVNFPSAHDFCAILRQHGFSVQPPRSYPGFIAYMYEGVKE